jgi:hypothetical protein
VGYVGTAASFVQPSAARRSCGAGTPARGSYEPIHGRESELAHVSPEQIEGKEADPDRTCLRSVAFSMKW